MSVVCPTLPETLPYGVRQYVLLRLREALDRGWRDPALLYAGARFALSLGLAASARIR